MLRSLRLDGHGPGARRVRQLDHGSGAQRRGHRSGRGGGTAAVTGGSPVTGGLLGGAAGAAIGGGLTDEDDLNLGDPIWDRDDDDNND